MLTWRLEAEKHLLCAWVKTWRAVNMMRELMEEVWIAFVEMEYSSDEGLSVCLLRKNKIEVQLSASPKVARRTLCSDGLQPSQEGFRWPIYDKPHYFWDV